MPATFDPALKDDVSLVRFKIGDTNVDNPRKTEVQDETIEFLLQSQSVGEAAYNIVLGIAAKYARYGDVTVDDQLQRYKHIYDNYMKLAERLGREIGVVVTTPAAALSPPIMVMGLNDRRGPLDDCDDYYRGRC